jgi:hypothetical protein
MDLIDYAREQMGTTQEYQDTRQAQALGMSSLASGPVRMPGILSHMHHNNDGHHGELQHELGI